MDQTPSAKFLRSWRSKSAIPLRTSETQVGVSLNVHLAERASVAG